MDELLEQFLIEGRELVAQASKDFAALSRDPTDVAAIDSAFRAIHTLKGSVVVFDLGPAERLLHAAEDLLDRVRKGTCALEAAETAALVASLDEVDRWIDDMERDGRLSEDALARSEQAITRLIARAAEPPSHDPIAGNQKWVTRLSERETSIIAGAAGPVVAFCYTPDADCFFRGEDPLAVAEAVPDLLTLAILPATGHGPTPRPLSHSPASASWRASVRPLWTAFALPSDCNPIRCNSPSWRPITGPTSRAQLASIRACCGSNPHG
ncbi:Hpt domain-containing protein [Novosphingobium sp. 9]|uniref:Hpt domain-containing protein n=1 Tax=Novosphingobium sp. 9 TaxID=2025349 RepID=UPI0021B6369F|nr:Hpt domain-containing protein [Novosphingobium sp. 9]